MKKLLILLIVLICCSGCTSNSATKKEISVEQITEITAFNGGRFYYNFNPTVLYDGLNRKGLISESKRKKVYEVTGITPSTGLEHLDNNLTSIIDIRAVPNENLQKGDVVTFKVISRIEDYTGYTLDDIEEILGVHFVPWEYTVE